MDRLIATNSVPLADADAAPASGTPQYATSGNPATGVPATVLPAYAWNMIQEELMAIIALAGIAPDKTNWGQVKAALQALFLTLTGGTLTGNLSVQGETAMSAVAKLVGNPQGAFNIQRTAAGDTIANSVFGIGVDDIISDGSGRAILRLGLNTGGPDSAQARNIPNGLALDIAGGVYRLLAGTDYKLWSDYDGGASLAASGYQKLPSGLIVQWGATGSIAAVTTYTQPLPVTFPNTCVAAFAVYHAGVNSSLDKNANVTNLAANSIDVTNNSGTASDIYYQAIGY
ncbi:MAG: hypothetical protein KGL39_46330 [Patescibacteria group bacterium]|nr:hypothetical protein [Patescibacteria group bacterium]